MSSAPFRLAALAAAHERTSFDSGSAALDRYLREQATQDQRRRVAACFVALAGQRIAGYYTLAAASLLLAGLPAQIAKKLPRHPTVPAVRLGRLAVDRHCQGRGLGGALLADALERSLRSEIAASAMVVDAKDEAAIAFYRHNGFIALPESPRTLFLPLASFQAARSSSSPAA